jgi:hypothetical protein
MKKNVGCLVYMRLPVPRSTAASKLLNWHHSLSHPTYMELLGDLRAIRTECNEDMLAITAHYKNTRELLTVH